jgi:hypothetical protein
MGVGVGAAILGSAVIGGAVAAKGAKDAAKSQAAAASNVADSADYAADLSYKLGNDQLNFEKEQYTANKSLSDRVVNSQIDMMNANEKRASDYSNYEINTFRPLEQGLVRDAEQFNTAAYQEQQASKAAADVGKAHTNAQGANQRAMMAMGINPNSGKFASMQNQSALDIAAQKASAMTNSRLQAEQIGYARKLDAAGLGRNLSGNSTAAYGLAGTMGNSAVNNQMAPGQQYSQGAGAASGIIMNGANNSTNAALQIAGLPNYEGAAQMAFGSQLAGAAMNYGLKKYG